MDFLLSVQLHYAINLLYFYETFLEGDVEAEDKKDRPNGGCS